jgi:hypothetical protein
VAFIRSNKIENARPKTNAKIVTFCGANIFWPVSACFRFARFNSRVVIGQNRCALNGKRTFAGRLLTQINGSKRKSRVDLGQATVDLRLELVRLLSGER